MRRTIAGLLAVAAAMAVSGAAVTARQVPAQAFVRGLDADFNNDNARGLVLVDRIRANSARLTTALVHLLPGHRYRLIVSSDGCGTPLPEADRIMIEWTRADAIGASFISRVIGTDGGLWTGARSVRLMEEEGIYYFCRPAHVFDDPGADDPDGSYARFSGGVFVGLTVNTGEGNDQVNFMLALKGLQPNVRYRLIHSPLTCKQFNEGDPDQPIVIGSFRSNGDGVVFASRSMTVGAAMELTVGSVRVQRRSDRAVWGCANLHPFVEFVTVG